MDFAIPVAHRRKSKESKKIDKYLNLARELKKIWNMRVSVIPVVVGALEISERIETIQTIALLRSARIPRVLETWGDLLSLSLQWKTTSKHWREKLTSSKIIMINLSYQYPIPLRKDVAIIHFDWLSVS